MDANLEEHNEGLIYVHNGLRGCELIRSINCTNQLINGRGNIFASARMMEVLQIQSRS